MAQVNPFAGAAAHLVENTWEHFLAVSCLTGVEVGFAGFVHRFGNDVHLWPTWLIILFGMVVYLAGLLTVIWVGRLRKHRAKRVIEIPLPLRSKRMKGDDTKIAVVGAAAVTAVALAVLLWRRRQ